MPLQYRLTPDGPAPVAICDVCDERVFAHDGACLYPLTESPTPDCSIWFYHRTNCYFRLESALASKYPRDVLGWSELDDFLEGLSASLGVDPAIAS